jgi:hypothetical protein
VAAAGVLRREFGDDGELAVVAHAEALGKQVVGTTLVLAGRFGAVAGQAEAHVQCGDGEREQPCGTGEDGECDDDGRAGKHDGAAGGRDGVPYRFSELEAARNLRAVREMRNSA